MLLIMAMLPNGTRGMKIEMNYTERYKGNVSVNYKSVSGHGKVMEINK